MKTLSGHVSPETAKVVPDYPYGFRLRTQIRYWLETKRGHGQRFMSQTLNPKTQKWNKPKTGIYSVILVMVEDESNGHISTESLRSGGWDSEEKISEFETRHASAIGEYEKKAIRYIRATNAASKYIHTTITINPGPDVVSQTREEAQAIYASALRAGYSDVISEGK